MGRESGPETECQILKGTGTSCLEPMHMGAIKTGQSMIASWREKSDAGTNGRSDMNRSVVSKVVTG